VVLVLAHISDTHFDGGPVSEARAERVMAYLNGLPGHLDAIVVTGDITDNGKPDEHAQAARVLRSHRPVFTCPGNHDGYTPYPAPLNAAHELGGALLLLADSVVLGEPHGHFADATLDWLSARLATADRPVLIGFHHPPVRLWHDLIDGINLSAPSQRELAALIDAHPRVAALLVGHAHTAATTTFAGRPVLVAPGVRSTLTLPWAMPAEPTWADALDVDQPPGVAFHVLDDDAHVTTHFRVVDHRG
jgi:Icc protein